MLGLKLNHVSKRGHRWYNSNSQQDLRKSLSLLSIKIWPYLQTADSHIKQVIVGVPTIRNVILEIITGITEFVPISGLGISKWTLNSESSHCNSFEDQVPVDQIYLHLIFKWVKEDIVPSQWSLDMPQWTLPEGLIGPCEILMTFQMSNFLLILVIDDWCISCEIAISWM